MKPQEVLASALSGVCDDLVEECRSVPLKHWNEAVFRHFFVRRLLRADPSLRVECEWNRVDAALFVDDGATLVEIKFFPYRGKEIRKGGPSRQNYAEFEQVIAKLSNIGHRSWAANVRLNGLFLVLVYFDPRSPSHRATFSSFYAQLKANHVLKSVIEIRSTQTIGDAVMTCKLLEVVGGSESRMTTA